MSLIIKGMEMPLNGYDCPLNSFGICCNLVTDGEHYECFDERPSWCPLVPLPEKHGRLIDAETLERVCKEIADCEWNKKAAPYSWEYAYNQFVDDEIFNAPTIVPAEGGTDNGENL